EAYAGTSSNPALSLFSFGSLGIRSTEPLLVLRRGYPRRITREERFIISDYRAARFHPLGQTLCEATQTVFGRRLFVRHGRVLSPGTNGRATRMRRSGFSLRRA